MTLQSEISARKLRHRVGRRETVLVDRIESGTVIARSRSDAPEIDGVVYITDAVQAQPGEFLDVEITDSTEHDLVARSIAVPRFTRRRSQTS
jgi:ribosomal protein S12 methylthiotransferase